MRPHKPRPFPSLRAIAALILREMSTTYGRSALGYVWAVLEPVAGLLLLSIIFSMALRSPGLGTSFALYYASGLLPFMAFMDVCNKVALALRFSRPLLAFPAITAVDPFLARWGLNTLTQALVSLLVFGGIILGFDLDVILNLPQLLLGYLMLFLLAFGLGLVNGVLFFILPAWERIWGIVTRPLFFLSCVFFLFETVPPPYAQLLWFNPLVHIIGQVRQGIYATYDPGYISVTYVLGLALICATLGLALLRRSYHDVITQ
jgi:capsular polysaccharide transport system permease protein